MIKDIGAFFSKQYLKKKLYHSWIIQSDDVEKTLSEVKSFISCNLFSATKVDLERHPDFHLVQLDSTLKSTKNISVSQIRDLKDFLYHTPGVEPCKAAIIFRSELMNVNASNSCLKILEDTPDNSYIFLITDNIMSMLPTIRSRCYSVYHREYEEDRVHSSYSKFLNSTIKGNVKDRLLLINELGGKNRELWLSITNDALQLISKIAKKSTGYSVKLSASEEQIISQMSATVSGLDPARTREKYNQITYLIDNSIKLDLDIRVSATLLLNIFT